MKTERNKTVRRGHFALHFYEEGSDEPFYTLRYASPVPVPHIGSKIPLPEDETETGDDIIYKVVDLIYWFDASGCDAGVFVARNLDESSEEPESALLDDLSDEVAHSIEAFSSLSSSEATDYEKDPVTSNQRVLPPEDEDEVDSETALETDDASENELPLDTDGFRQEMGERETGYRVKGDSLQEVDLDSFVLDFEPLQQPTKLQPSELTVERIESSLGKQETEFSLSPPDDSGVDIDAPGIVFERDDDGGYHIVLSSPEEDTEDE